MEPGEQVGSYRITRKLGEGGMGAVYEAVHTQLGRQAAIKVLHPELSKDQDTLTRFFNEARAVNIVNHPGLVQIFEFGHTPAGAAYIVMEFLAGESLRSRLKQHSGGLGLSSLIIARQLATALSATHEKHIVHRDLKPDNVMLVPDAEMPGGERVKVLDFGIAKLASDPSQQGNLAVRTRTGAVMGTPVYMSPEQCRGNASIDDRTDVYALGVMMFEMIAGHPPFESSGFGELVGMHMFQPPPSLDAIAPKTPPAVVKLVASMLHKTAAERPRMSVVTAELERMIAQLGLRGGMAVVSLTEAPDETRVISRAAAGAPVTTLHEGSGQQRISPSSRPKLALWGVFGLAMLIAGVLALRHSWSRPTITVSQPPASSTTLTPQPEQRQPAATQPTPTTTAPAALSTVSTTTTEQPQTAPRSDLARTASKRSKKTSFVDDKPTTPVVTPAAPTPPPKPKFEKVKPLD